VKTEMPSSAFASASAWRTNLQEAPPCRGERPLPAGVALHLDAVADHRGRQPLTRFLFVQIVRIDGEQMNLFPGRLEENLRGGCGEPRALLDRDLAGRVANVVAEDLASQALGARRLAPLRDRLHDFELGADPDGPRNRHAVPSRLRAHRLAGPAPAHGLNLGHDRQGDLGRRARADVEADRYPDALERGVALPLFGQELQNGRAAPARAEHADVTDVGGERLVQHRQVVLVVVRHQHERGRRHERIRADELRGDTDLQLVDLAGSARGSRTAAGRR
jgi:hypothetical protein